MNSNDNKVQKMYNSLFYGIGTTSISIYALNLLNSKRKKNNKKAINLSSLGDIFKISFGICNLAEDFSKLSSIASYSIEEQLISSESYDWLANCQWYMHSGFSHIRDYDIWSSGCSALSVINHELTFCHSMWLFSGKSTQPPSDGTASGWSDSIPEETQFWLGICLTWMADVYKLSSHDSWSEFMADVSTHASTAYSEDTSYWTIAYNHDSGVIEPIHASLYFDGTSNIYPLFCDSSVLDIVIGFSPTLVTSYDDVGYLNDDGSREVEFVTYSKYEFHHNGGKYNDHFWISKSEASSANLPDISEIEVWFQKSDGTQDGPYGISHVNPNDASDYSNSSINTYFVQLDTSDSSIENFRNKYTVGAKAIFRWSEDISSEHKSLCVLSYNKGLPHLYDSQDSYRYVTSEHSDEILTLPSSEFGTEVFSILYSFWRGIVTRIEEKALVDIKTMEQNINQSKDEELNELEKNNKQENTLV